MDVRTRGGASATAFATCLLAAIVQACSPAGEAAAGAGVAAPPAAAPAPAPAPAAPVAAPAQASDAGLPIRTGYYVNTEVECGGASNATLALVRRDGISACEFTRIDRTADARYRVAERCHDHQAPPGSEGAYFGIEQDYEVLGDGRYRIVFEYGGTSEFRFCPQDTLPEPWRDNDISDLVG